MMAELWILGVSGAKLTHNCHVMNASQSKHNSTHILYPHFLTYTIHLLSPVYLLVSENIEVDEGEQSTAVTSDSVSKRERSNIWIIL